MLKVRKFIVALIMSVLVLSNVVANEAVWAYSNTGDIEAGYTEVMPFMNQIMFSGNAGINGIFSSEFVPRDTSIVTANLYHTNWGTGNGTRWINLRLQYHNGTSWVNIYETDLPTSPNPWFTNRTLRNARLGRRHRIHARPSAGGDNFQILSGSTIQFR